MKILSVEIEDGGNRLTIKTDQVDDWQFLFFTAQQLKEAAEFIDSTN